MKLRLEFYRITLKQNCISVLILLVGYRVEKGSKQLQASLEPELSP